MWKILLARLGLAPAPYTAHALKVQKALLLLERHLAGQKDYNGMLLAQALHDGLWQAAQAAPAGLIDLAPLSATPKPPAQP